VLNQAAVDRSRAARGNREFGDDMGWGFHWDDIDPDIRAAQRVAAAIPMAIAQCR